MSESKGINKKLNKNENASNLEYKRRIHVVQDYMEEHLDPPLTLETLSNVAGFSKYHFSRIFQGIIQEPLVHYVNRNRMERTLFLLAHREDKSITDIAFEIGIQDSAVFSRAFKNYYGTSPSTYRKDYSKNCKESFLLSSYNKKAADFPLLNDPTNLKVKTPWNESVIPNGGIVLENLVEKQLFYVRHTGTYETLEKEYERLIGVLFSQAEKQKVFPDDNNWVLAMYHDNPEFGVEHQFRTSLCLAIPEGVTPKEDGILGAMVMEGGLYAVGHFHILQEEYGAAWDYMYREWITGSGYAPVIGPDVISGILANATGGSVLSFAQKNLFEPLDIYVPDSVIFHSKQEHIDWYKERNTKGWIADSKGVNTTAWGLSLSTVDMAKIGQLYANGGVWCDKQIITKEWIMESTREQSYCKQFSLAYGYLWWVEDEKERIYAAWEMGVM